MKTMRISKAFTLIEPGPVVLITTNDGQKNNIMTISWSMVMDFSPRFAITTGSWNFSYHELQDFRECVIAIPAVDLIDQVVGVGTCSGADTDKFKKFGLTPLKGKRSADSSSRCFSSWLSIVAICFLHFIKGIIICGCERAVR